MQTVNCPFTGSSAGGAQLSESYSLDRERELSERIIRHFSETSI